MGNFTYLALVALLTVVNISYAQPIQQQQQQKQSKAQSHSHYIFNNL